MENGGPRTPARAAVPPQHIASTSLLAPRQIGRQLEPPYPSWAVPAAAGPFQGTLTLAPSPPRQVLLPPLMLRRTRGRPAVGLAGHEGHGPRLGGELCGRHLRGPDRVQSCGKWLGSADPSFVSPSPLASSHLSPGVRAPRTPPHPGPGTSGGRPPLAEAAPVKRSGALSSQRGRQDGRHGQQFHRVPPQAPAAAGGPPCRRLRVHTG